jgi:4-amino-4-deoxy-L-arabinose transferase-like glycosyltransferase
MVIGLGARVFTNNDEARFPMLAQDILSRGDWLWPRLNGVGYYNKPPLLAWLIAVVSWPVGHVTQLTAVVPSAAAEIATVMLVYWLGRDLFGIDAGRFAALVAMTTQGLFRHGHLALPDVLMTCFITASVWMLARMAQARPGPWWIGFYGFAGMAFWAKGPAGLLPLAVGIAYAAVVGRHRTWSLRLASGVPLVGGLVGLWWLLGSLSNSQALAHAVVTDHLAWYRPQAPGLGALTAPVRNLVDALFPWVLLAPVTIPWVVRFRGERRSRGALGLLLVWIGVTVALVGASHQQRLRYYVPVVPPAALVIGWWLQGAAREYRRIDRILWRVCLAVALLLILGAATALAANASLWRRLLAALPGSPLSIVAIVGALAVILVALILGAFRHNARGAVVAMWIGSALWLIASDRVDVERHNVAGDYAHLAAGMAPLLGEAPLVAAWGMAELPLAFYADRTVVSMESDRELRDVMAREPRSLVVATEANWRRLEEPGLTVLARDRLASKPVVLVRGGGGS